MTDLFAYICVLSNLVIYSKKGKVFNNLMENFQSFFFFRNSLHSTHLNASVLSNSAWRQHSFSPWEKAEKGAFTARSKVCRPRAPSVTSTPRSCTRVTAAFTHAAGGFSFGVTTKRRRHAWELHTDFFFLLRWQFYPPLPPFSGKSRHFQPRAGVRERLLYATTSCRVCDTPTRSRYRRNRPPSLWTNRSCGARASGSPGPCWCPPSWVSSSTRPRWVQNLRTAPGRIF